MRAGVKNFFSRVARKKVKMPSGKIFEANLRSKFQERFNLNPNIIVRSFLKL